MYVPGPYPGFNALTQTKRKAPFPDDEVTGLVRLMDKIQKEFDLTLTHANDNITQDGRFATTLAINYDQFLDNATATLLPKGKVPNAACNIIHKYVKSIAEWNEGSANDLDFTSKRQLQCLKNAKQPSADFLKKVKLSKPSMPIISQMAAGMEYSMKISNQSVVNAERRIICEACSGADDQALKSFKLIDDLPNDDRYTIVYLSDYQYSKISDAINVYYPKLTKALKSFEDRAPNAIYKQKTYFMSDTPEVFQQVLVNLNKITAFHNDGKVTHSLFSTFSELANRDKVSVESLAKIGGITVAAIAKYGKVFFNEEWLDKKIDNHLIEEIAKTTLHEIIHLAFKYRADLEDYAYSHESLEDFQQRDPDSVTRFNRSIYSLSSDHAIRNNENYVGLVFSY